MTEKPSSSRNGLAGTSPKHSFDFFLIAIWLFGAWAFARYAVRLLAYLLPTIRLGPHKDLVDIDFANYWVGGLFVRAGNVSVLFKHDEYFQRLREIFGNEYQIHSWSYPPHFLMLVAPLGWLDYFPALVAFLISTFALFVWGTHSFTRLLAPEVAATKLWLLISGFVFAMVYAAQNGFLTSATLLLALAFMRDRPVLAGLALALLTTKPQLGFLVPLLAMFDRNWAFLRWTIVFTIALIGSSVALFGIEPWILYVHDVIPYQNLVMTKWGGGFIWLMPSAFGSARLLGASGSTALVLHVVVALAALLALVRILIVNRDPLERMFAMLAATFLITPYAFNYDMGAFSVVAGCLAWKAHAAGARTRAWMFAAASTLPAYISWLAAKSLPLSPLVLAGALALLLLPARERNARAISAPS